MPAGKKRYFGPNLPTPTLYSTNQSILQGEKAEVPVDLLHRELPEHWVLGGDDPHLNVGRLELLGDDLAIGVVLSKYVLKSLQDQHDHLLLAQLNVALLVLLELLLDVVNRLLLLDSGSDGLK